MDILRRLLCVPLLSQCVAVFSNNPSFLPLSSFFFPFSYSLLPFSLPSLLPLSPFYPPSLPPSFRKIPPNYKILLLQGGGTAQFAAIPMNLSRSSDQVTDYFVTGIWSNKAAKEAEKYTRVNHVLPKRSQFTNIPSKDQWQLTPDAAYVYYCANETVHGGW